MNDEPTKILLIEGDPDDALLIQELLTEDKGASFNLERTNRLSTGLERLEQGDIDAILLNLSLPDAQGLDTFLKVYAQSPTVPTLVLTDLDGEALAARAVREGARDYLIKERMNGDLLTRAVRYAIGRARAEAALLQAKDELERRVGECTAELRAANELLQREIETHRQAERDRAQQYLDIIEVILVALDREGNITLINRKGGRILGYEEGELIRKNWFDTCLPPQTREDVKSVFHKLMTGEIEPVEYYENPVLTKDGKERMIAWHNTIVRDEAGNIMGALSSGEDITERKQAEEALEESVALLRATLEATADGIITVAKDLQVVNFNRKFNEIWGFEEDWGNVPLLDERLSRMAECLKEPERVFERVRELYDDLTTESYDFVHLKDGRIFERYSTPYRIDGEIAGRVWSFRDITEREQAKEALQHHTDRLEALHEIDQGILAARSAEAIAQVALSRMRQLVPCQRASVTMFDHEAHQVVVLAVSADGETELVADVRDSMEIGAAEELWQGRVRVEKDIATLPQPSAIEKILLKEGIHAYVNTPLLVHNHLIGSLNLGARNPDAFTPEHLDIAREVAAPLAIAIHQAQLREQVQRHAEELEQRVMDRTRELMALYQVSAVASESLDVETTLKQALERALAAMNSTTGFIHLLDEQSGAPQLAVQKGLTGDIEPQERPSSVGDSLVSQVIERRRPVVVSTAATDPRAATPTSAGPATYAGVPMRAGGEMVGVLSVIREADQPQFNREEIALLASVADQVGVVVESARLRQRAERAAVLEERQRLARELHDSVTQSLYSLTLLTETGRRLVRAGDLEGVSSHLERLAGVAQQALKEMRLLIYELRPLTLEQEGLAGALQQRLDAVEGRAGVEVRLLVETEAELAAPVEEALYRIALEALNNALKHAAATSVTVRIRADGEQAELEVTDNGCGFDPQAVRDAGGMGLITMRERAERLGGTLTVLSAPGEGTKVSVVVGS